MLFSLIRRPQLVVALLKKHQRQPVYALAALGRQLSIHSLELHEEPEEEGADFARTTSSLRLQKPVLPVDSSLALGSHLSYTESVLERIKAMIISGEDPSPLELESLSPFTVAIHKNHNYLPMIGKFFDLIVHHYPSTLHSRFQLANLLLSWYFFEAGRAISMAALLTLSFGYFPDRFPLDSESSSARHNTSASVSLQLLTGETVYRLDRRIEKALLSIPPFSFPPKLLSYLLSSALYAFPSADLLAVTTHLSNLSKKGYILSESMFNFLVHHSVNLALKALKANPQAKGHVEGIPGSGGGGGELTAPDLSALPLRLYRSLKENPQYMSAAIFPFLFDFFVASGWQLSHLENDFYDYMNASKEKASHDESYRYFVRVIYRYLSHGKIQESIAMLQRFHSLWSPLKEDQILLMERSIFNRLSTWIRKEQVLEFCRLFKESPFYLSAGSASELEIEAKPWILPTQIDTIAAAIRMHARILTLSDLCTFISVVRRKFDSLSDADEARFDSQFHSALLNVYLKTPHESRARVYETLLAPYRLMMLHDAGSSSNSLLAEIFRAHDPLLAEYLDGIEGHGIVLEDIFATHLMHFAFRTREVIFRLFDYFSKTDPQWIQSIKDNRAYSSIEFASLHRNGPSHPGWAPLLTQSVFPILVRFFLMYRDWSRLAALLWESRSVSHECFRSHDSAQPFERDRNGRLSVLYQYWRDLVQLGATVLPDATPIHQALWHVEFDGNEFDNVHIKSQASREMKMKNIKSLGDLRIIYYEKGSRSTKATQLQLAWNELGLSGALKEAILNIAIVPPFLEELRSHIVHQPS